MAEHPRAAAADDPAQLSQLMAQLMARTALGDSAAGIAGAARKALAASSLSGAIAALQEEDEEAHDATCDTALADGVVENGLFLDICDVIVIGKPDGTVEVRDINNGTVEHERIDIADTENLFVDKAE